MERKNAPIHLIFGDHSDQGLDGLFLMSRIARAQLEEQPDRCVGIFIEAVNFTVEQNQQFQRGIARGMLPTAALYSVFSWGELVVLPEFAGTKFQIYDSLFKCYPGRVQLVSERGTQDQIDSQLPSYNPMLGFHIYRGSALRDREGRIIDLIQEAVLQTGISSMVGHLGALHTRVGISLERAGFTVHRYFPQKTAGCYVFPDDAVPLRRLLFNK